MDLSERICLFADAAEAAGVAVDGSFGGPVHQWVCEHVACEHHQKFFVVFLLTAELADREARRQGYRDQCHRAAELAFSNR